MNLIGLRLLKLSFAALTALVVVLAAALWWTPDGELRPHPAVRIPPRAIKSPNETAPPPFSRFEALTRSAMFGRREVEEPAPTAAAKLELPSLEGYRLIGLMTGAKNLSWAVVENKASGIQDVVGEGDSVGPGKVAAILPDRVVIDLNGQRRQLLLEDYTAQALSGILTIKGASAGPDRESRPESRDIVAEENEPLRLLPVAGREDAVAVLSPGPVGAALGLRPGDVIQARSPEEVQRGLDRVVAGEALDLKIDRGGQKLSIHFVPH